MYLATFMNLYLGKTGVGDTPENIGECTGLVEQWLDANNKPHVWGDAKDLLVNADLRAYHVYHNQPTNYPSSGDIVVWDKSWGQGHGHCAVVVAANAMYLATFEQNDPLGAACTVATHTYVGVVGWLRFVTP